MNTEVLLNPKVHEQLMIRGFYSVKHINERDGEEDVASASYDLYSGIGEFVFVDSKGIFAVERRDLSQETCELSEWANDIMIYEHCRQVTDAL